MLSLRYSGYHSSPKESQNNASVYNFFFLGGEEGTVGGTRFIIGNAKVANFRLTI